MNMKIKNLIFIFILMSLLLIKIDVKAATCSTDELNALKIEANNLEFENNLDKFEYYGENGLTHYYYYTLSTLNYSDNLKIFIDDIYYDKSNMGKNHEIVFPGIFGQGSKKTIQIYGSSQSACNGELLATKIVTLPYYNEYSTYKECQNYQNYNICKPTTNTENIDEEEFFKLLEEIKRKEEEAAQQPKIEEKKQSIFDLYWEYRYITIPVTFLIIVLIGIMIFIHIRNKKTKIKIDLGENL